jgi:hypothetical protein
MDPRTLAFALFYVGANKSITCVRYEYLLFPRERSPRRVHERYGIVQYTNIVVPSSLSFLDIHHDGRNRREKDEG